MRAILLTVALLGPAAVQGQQPAPDPRATAAATANAQGDRIRHAEALLEKGDYQAAESELQRLAGTSPKDPTILCDLGFTQEHNGEEDAAARSYTAAVAADPTSPEPRLALGLLEARAGHVEDARVQLEAVAGLNTAAPPLRARALRALARLNESMRPQVAADELLQATQLTGEQPGDAELSASLAARSGDPADAEAAFRRVLAHNSGDIAATVGLAAVLQHEGKLAQADALLTPALSAHPDDPQITARAAALYAAEDKVPEAEALVEKLRRSDPKAASDPALTRLLAHLQLISGNAAEAESLYRSLVAEKPNDPTVMDDLGSTLVREQKFAEAEAVLTRAVGMREAFHDDAAWGEAAGHLAFAASRNHQPLVTLQALAQRATVLPNSPATLFLEATAHDALHQTRQAEQSYRAFLAVANGKLPDEEFEARHRLIALQHEH